MMNPDYYTKKPSEAEYETKPNTKFVIWFKSLSNGILYSKCLEYITYFNKLIWETENLNWSFIIH